MEHYIFNSSSLETIDLKRVPSVEVIKHRLALKMWPLYSNTANRGKIEVGDACVFYAAGYQTGAKHFVAKATISEIKDCPKGLILGKENWLTDPADTVVHLTDIVIFSDPVSIRDRLDRLSFISNKKAWGNTLQGGTRRISKADFVSCLP